MSSARRMVVSNPRFLKAVCLPGLIPRPSNTSKSSFAWLPKSTRREGVGSAGPHSARALHDYWRGLSLKRLLRGT